MSPIAHVEQAVPPGYLHKAGHSWELTVVWLAIPAR